MIYSVTLAMCFCCLLWGTGSKAGDMVENQEINNVAVDFHNQISLVNSTSEVGSSSEYITWIWKPVGHERNKVEFESVLRHFSKDEASSGEIDEPVAETQKDGTWSFDEKIEEGWNKTQTPKTFDKKRKRTEEKAYLIYEKNLRGTNWCFQETEHAKQNHKFKKTSMCCRRHKECRTRKYIKRGIHECSCDIYFHICLKRAGTKMAKSIEKIYFNRNIVCYKKATATCTADKPCAKAIYVWKTISAHLK